MKAAPDDDAPDDDARIIAHTEESNAAVFAVLAAAVVVSAFSWTSLCAAQYACIHEGTCHAISEGSCSFRNAVTPAGFRIFNVSQEVSALASLTRGVCSPGERQTVKFGTSTLACTRSPSFPNAFTLEAGNPEATESHQRACGRWIDAKKAPVEVEYYSFFDEDEVEREVLEAVEEDFSTFYQTTDRQIFQSACERMLTNGAIAPAASVSYEHLKSKLPTEDTEEGVLKAIGILNAHYCDAPILLGLSFASTGEKFDVVAVDGSLLSSDASIEALLAMGETSTARDQAREFASELVSAPAQLLQVPTAAQLSTIFEASVANTWVDDSLAINSPVAVNIADDATSLSKFLYAMAETSPAHAHAYVLAETSRCALSVRSTITGDFGSSLQVKESVDALRKSRRPAAAFGKLKVGDGARFGTINDTDALHTNKIRWSSFTSSSVLDWTSASTTSSCYSAAKIAFSEEFDQQIFNKLVEDKLHTTILPPMATMLKNAVAAELESGRSSSILQDAASRTKLAALARSVEFRIAGAPRSRPFGRNRGFTRDAFKADDGALTMLLKQANALYLDRLSMALDGSSICDHAPFFTATSRNAYLLTAAPCSVLFPGILTAPFASSRYNEPSLYSRIGYVVAHEIAHVASKRNLWDEDAAARLLQNYSSSTWLEAAADVAAVDAVVATGVVTPATLCNHVSQLWCARVPSGVSFEGASHPGPNLRGNAACAWLGV
jgi:hypothetical protein